MIFAHKKSFWFILLALSLGVLILIAQPSVNSESIQQFLHTYILNTYVTNDGKGAVILFAALSITMGFGLPRQIAAFTCGYIFGAAFGVLIATCSAIVGCFITLTLARYLFSGVITTLFPKQTKFMNTFFAQQTFSKAMIIRLVPAGSNFITNLLAGVVHAPMKAYLLGSGVGFVPQMIIFSLIGSGVRVQNQHHIMLGIGLSLIAFALSYWLYRHTNMTKKNRLLLAQE